MSNRTPWPLEQQLGSVNTVGKIVSGKLECLIRYFEELRLGIATWAIRCVGIYPIELMVQYSIFDVDMFSISKSTRQGTKNLRADHLEFRLRFWTGFRTRPIQIHISVLESPRFGGSSSSFSLVSTKPYLMQHLCSDEGTGEEWASRLSISQDAQCAFDIMRTVQRLDSDS